MSPPHTVLKVQRCKKVQLTVKLYFNNFVGKLEIYSLNYVISRSLKGLKKFQNL